MRPLLHNPPPFSLKEEHQDSSVSPLRSRKNYKKCKKYIYFSFHLFLLHILHINDNATRTLTAGLQIWDFIWGNLWDFTQLPLEPKQAVHTNSDNYKYIALKTNNNDSCKQCYCWDPFQSDLMNNRNTEKPIEILCNQMYRASRWTPHSQHVTLNTSRSS